VLLLDSLRENIAIKRFKHLLSKPFCAAITNIAKITAAQNVADTQTHITSDLVT